MAEAHRAGLTRKHLRGASWHRVARGLYVWAGLRRCPDLVLSAAQCRLPTTAVFAGRTAAWLHGLDLPPCDPVEVAVPPGCGVSARAGLSVRRAALADDEVVPRHGFPAMSILRTIADLSQRLPLVEAVVAVDMALRLRLVDLPGLLGLAATSAGRMGVVRLRRVVELADPAAESAMETRLRVLLVLGGLPRPRAQVRLHDERGRFLGRARSLLPRASARYRVRGWPAPRPPRRGQSPPEPPRQLRIPAPPVYRVRRPRFA